MTKEWKKWNNPRGRTHKILYPDFISTRSQTHSLCGATQCHFPPPHLVPLATCSEPGLNLIDSITTPGLRAKTRCRKVGLWVAGTTLRMETNGLEIFRGWPCKGELNIIVFQGSIGEGADKRRSTWEKKKEGFIINFTYTWSGWCGQESAKNKNNKQSSMSGLFIIDTYPGHPG